MATVFCTQCGQQNPEDARFCARCGTPLTRPGTGLDLAEQTSTVSFGALDTLDSEAPETDVGHDVAETLPPGSALLVVKRGPNAGSRFLLDQDVTTVGRHPESEIFLDDVTVSRRHAEFVRDERGFLVRDVGSLNGTYLNRERIDESALSSGDEVQVGKFRLVYFAGPPVGGPRRAAGA
jgi:hypothetical protein